MIHTQLETLSLNEANKMPYPGNEIAHMFTGKDKNEKISDSWQMHIISLIYCHLASSAVGRAESARFRETAGVVFCWFYEGFPCFALHRKGLCENILIG